VITRELQQVRQALGKAWYRKLIREGVDTPTAKLQATEHADAWTRFFVEAGACVISHESIAAPAAQAERKVDVPNPQRQMELI
jgi:hypothetical protein